MWATLDDSRYQIELYPEYLETTLFDDPRDQQEFCESYIRGRGRCLPARIVEHVRIVLRAADGLLDKEIAQQLGITRTTVDYDRSLIPGVIVMALFMGSLTSGVFNWVMDRFMGITECYLVTPLSRWNLAAGVLGSSVLVTSVASVIVLAVGLLITGGTITGGAPAAAMLVGVIIIGATGILAMTFVLLARANNPRVVGASAGFLNVILFFPSGAIYPIESFPPWLRTFAHYNPETHAVSALKSILFKGANFAAISSDVTFLIVFTAIMLVIASMTVKRTL